MKGSAFWQLLLQPLERFYASAKLLFMWRMNRKFKAFSKGPILVLQMGKVGSSSIKAGLAATVTDRAIYHTHFLSPERTADTEERRRKFFRTERYSYLRRPWINQFLFRKYNEPNNLKPWKIVTLTREPVARNISAFFENLDVIPSTNEGEYEISSEYYRIPPTVVSTNCSEQLSELFFGSARHDSPAQFFDREIRDVFGIDVYQESFSIEKGFQIYRNSNVEVLVMRLESMEECVCAALEEFLGIINFQTINRNIAAKKIYAPLYDAFKKNAVIGEEYLSALYESRYAKMFYSPDEISVARASWSKSGAHG